MDAEGIGSLIRCACHFRDRARGAASEETRRFHLGWMRAHALEAARRIRGLRESSRPRGPLSPSPYKQRDPQGPFVSETSEREIVYVECVAGTVWLAVRERTIAG